jgi:hypothetical protein
MDVEPLSFMEAIVRRVQLNEQDKKLLKQEAEWGKAIAPKMADIFYDYLGRDEEMNTILHAKQGRIHRLRETFIQWFSEMFTGIDGWSKAYADCRWKIGLVHVRIGIGPQHVVPAMAVVVTAVRQQLRRDQKSEALSDALSKICMIDLAFIEQAHAQVLSEALFKETGWTQALFQRLIAKGAETV